MWVAKFDSVRFGKRIEAKESEVKRSESEAKSEASGCEAIDEDRAGGPGVPRVPPPVHLPYHPAALKNQRSSRTSIDPPEPKGPPRGSPGPLDTSKGHPGNPPGPLLAPQLSGQSVPGQLIDYVVGVWDLPTSPGVGLGA